MKIVLSGGGTGGHIYPALSIAQQCLRHDPETQIMYIGTNKGLESEIVPKANLPFRAIEISGFKRKLSFDNMRTIWKFIQGVKTSKRWLREFQPDIVVGTGGYVCGPVVYAAAKLGIPTIIHEQNVIPGLTNAFLSRYCDCVAVSFKGSESHFPKASKVIYTGNPRASEVVRANPETARAMLDIPEHKPIVVMVGGSRGAKALNDAMVEMASLTASLDEAHFVYITGEPYYESTRRQIEETLHDLPGNLHILPYVDEMPALLAATSLIITRSGASFLSEITALGIPSIQIPSPNVTNNHQEANARWLSEAGAAELILEQDLNGTELFQRIERIIRDPIRRESMAIQSKKLGQPDAVERIFNEITRLVEAKHGRLSHLSGYQHKITHKRD